MKALHRRTLLALALQAAALLALAAGLAGLSWLDPRSQPTLLVLLDRSLSMPRQPVDQAVQGLAQAVQQAGGRLQTLDFAGRVAPAVPPADGSAPDLAQEATHLQAALEAALALHARQPLAGLVLVSDAHATAGDSEAGLRAARSAGLAVGWIPIGRPPPRQRIVGLLAPQHARSGQPVRVTAQVDGARDRPLRVRATARALDGRSQAAQAEVDAQGRAELRFDALAPGAWVVEAALVDGQDATPLHTLADAAVLDVQAAAPLLYVQGGPAALADSLVRGGWALQRVPAARLDGQADALAGVRAVVLDDVAATDAGPRLWAALDIAVRQHGLGLLVLGGDRSFARGGYRGSELETLLPVLAEPAAMDQPLSLVFAVDKSGSMGQGSGGVDRFAMAQRAVQDTARGLGERDALGLVLFDAAPRVLLPLGPAAAGQAALQRDWQASPRGGTQLAPGLQAALAELAKAPASRRMLVLVTDGFVDDAPLAELRARLQQDRIETIVLAVGPDADVAALQRLVGDGGGQVLRVNEAAELPRVMRSGFERRRARVQQGAITVQQRQDLPFAPGRFADWPPVAAYAVTRAKPQATVAVQTESAEPLIAWHRAGLGRVAVVTSGLGPWAPQWLGWRHWPPLAGGLAEWVASAGQGGTALTVTDNADALQIDAEGPPGDAPLLRVDSPGAPDRPVDTDLLVPGRWRARVPAAGPGLYTLRLTTAQGTQRHLHLRRPSDEAQTFGIHPALAAWRAAGWVVDANPATLLRAPAPTADTPPPDRSLLLLSLLLFLAGVGVDRSGGAAALWTRLSGRWRRWRPGLNGRSA
ncbi:putative membrane protein [Burkholderiales bacterium JOSHI_001]|nr:putative membrane protein [Burkholderiales bacterium JOSHI_001]